MGFGCRVTGLGVSGFDFRGLGRCPFPPPLPLTSRQHREHPLPLRPDGEGVEVTPDPVSGFRFRDENRFRVSGLRIGVSGFGIRD